MRFTRVIGKINPSLVAQAEEKLSKVFIELGVRYDNEHVGVGYGGDPLIFSLMYPVEHVCTMNLPTAATDGKRYYWNPKYVLKTSLKGLRMICGHEAWHAMYMHPSRRGARNPKLWNIAVDYIVNGTVMDDLKARKKDAANEFTKNLGRYMPLKTFCQLVKDPFKKIPGFEDINPLVPDPNKPAPGMPGPNEDRELTPEEQRELEKREKGVRFYYGDPDLEDEMKRPEKIYETLYALLPKCPKCGRIGIYKKPNPNPSPGSKKKDKGDGSDGEEDKNGKPKKGKCGHQHGDGEQCDCPDQGDGQQGDQPDDGDGDGDDQGCCNPGGPCSECGGGVDIFGLGGTVDDHMDSEESEEKMAKRISEAMEAARKLAGHIPAALEDELGKLTAPKIKWQDVIRCRLIKSRAGNNKNDWTRFRTRPMFSGLLVPKRRSYHATFIALLDTSCSMSREDMSFGVSQLIGLDDRSEGIIVPCDCQIYWDQATKIKTCKEAELTKVKVVGRGGTMFAPFFTDYEKNLGKADFLILMTDGYLMDTDIAEMKDPGIPVYWIIVSGSTFVAPFGRVFSLRE